MKKHLFLKSLLVAIGLLVTSLTTQLWARWYLPADIHYKAWSNNNNPMSDDSERTIVFYAVPAGDHFFRLSNGSSQSGSCINTAVDDYISAAGWNDESNYITTTELRDIHFKVVDQTNWKVNVWTTAPSVMIKYPWNDGETWKWSNSMSSNGDGTYACVGEYGGTSYNKIKKTQNHDTGDEATATIDGTTPSNGDMCVFTYTVSTGALSIRKCNNITPTNYIFFDNSASSLTRTHKYFVMGRPVAASAATSKTYELGEVEHTKLWLHTSTTDTWTDANYFAVLGSDDYFSNGNWYHDNIKVASEYSAPYLTHYNMESGHNYIVSKADATNGTPISINEKGTTASSLNSTQTIKYSISRNGGSTYTEQNSGVTPAEINISSYKFNDGTYGSVESNSNSVSVNQTSAYATSVQAAYTGETSLSYTSKREGYTFIGWYNDASGGSVVASPYYPTTGGTVYARFKAHRYTIEFNRNDAQYSGTIASGEMSPISNVVYDQSQTLTANAFKREGYTFAGWATSPTGAVVHADEASVSNLSSTDGATVTLYAKWTDTRLYYYKGESANGWSTASNWTRNAVPGTGDNVIALKPLATPDGKTTVANVSIATSGTYTPVGGSAITANGKLTISGGTMLEVTGGIRNCEITANSPTSYVATTASTLEVGVGGAIVWGESGPQENNATVACAIHSGGAPGSEDAINQYFGIPFTSMHSGVFSNAWVFQVSGNTWAEMDGTMSPWTGYNIIRQLASDGDSKDETYYLSGELVGIGSIGSGVSAGSEILYANSWLAPIHIKNITMTGTATIYIFSPQSASAIVDKDNPVGNYTAYSVNESATATIPSMQSFSTYNGSVSSISYADAVRTNAAAGGNAHRAPRREREYDYRQAFWDTQDSLFVNVTCASGWGDELKMFIHEDFSQDYENGWDGPKMEGLWEAPKLYALNNEGEMAVACVPTVENSVIGFHAGTAANEYSMTLKYSGEDELYLRDTKTGVETPITEETKYEFTSDAKDSDMRFVIKKAPKIVTGMEEVGTNSNVQKFLHNGTLYIIRDGRIYNAEGSLVK